MSWSSKRKRLRCLFPCTTDWQTMNSMNTRFLNHNWWTWTSFLCASKQTASKRLATWEQVSFTRSRLHRFWTQAPRPIPQSGPPPWAESRRLVHRPQNTSQGFDLISVDIWFWFTVIYLIDVYRCPNCNHDYRHTIHAKLCSWHCSSSWLQDRSFWCHAPTIQWMKLNDVQTPAIVLDPLRLHWATLFSHIDAKPTFAKTLPWPYSTIFYHLLPSFTQQSKLTGYTSWHYLLMRWESVWWLTPRRPREKWRYACRLDKTNKRKCLKKHPVQENICILGRRAQVVANSHQKWRADQIHQKPATERRKRSFKSQTNQLTQRQSRVEHLTTSTNWTLLMVLLAYQPFVKAFSASSRAQIWIPWRSGASCAISNLTVGLKSGLSQLSCDSILHIQYTTLKWIFWLVSVCKKMQKASKSIKKHWSWFKWPDFGQCQAGRPRPGPIIWPRGWRKRGAGKRGHEPQKLLVEQWLVSWWYCHKWMISLGDLVMPTTLLQEKCGAKRRLPSGRRLLRLSGPESGCNWSGTNFRSLPEESTRSLGVLGKHVLSSWSKGCLASSKWCQVNSSPPEWSHDHSAIGLPAPSALEPFVWPLRHAWS